MTGVGGSRGEDGTEAAVLDALVERGEEGMTVLELRSSVDADIDAIEAALADLKLEGLISVESEDGTMVIKPDAGVMPEQTGGGDAGSVIDWVRERFPF